MDSAIDIETFLNWDIEGKPDKPKQMQLFNDLTEEEKLIVDTIKTAGELPFDHIYLQTGLTVSAVSALLLNLEFSGIVKSLPGKVYKLV